MEHLLALGVESYLEAEINLSIMDIVDRLEAFIENEGKSCSYDPELITPLYVYRMWGGRVAIEEITNAMSALRQSQRSERRKM